MFECEPCLTTSRHVSATHVCEDCQERYCQRCKEDHKKFRVLKGHKIIPIETKTESTEYEEININEDDIIRDKYDEVTVNRTVQSNAIAIGLDKLESETENYSYAQGSADYEEIIINEVEKIRDSHDMVTADQSVQSNVTDVGLNKLQLDTEYYSFAQDDAGTVNSFYIDVEDTAMSRVIGINGKQCLLMIDPDLLSLSISHGSVKLFDSNFKVVRRCIFTHDSAKCKLEFGRKCQTGEGVLIFKCNEIQSLKTFITNAMRSVEQKQNNIR